MNKQQAAELENDPNSLVIGKALFNTQHYSYFFYRQTPLNRATLPDILYSTKDEGEILIEWDSLLKDLSMRIFIDITGMGPKTLKYA